MLSPILFYANHVHVHDRLFLSSQKVNIKRVNNIKNIPALGAVFADG